MKGNNLPNMCFSTMPHSGKLIVIKNGETGYYPSEGSTSSPVENRELAEANNAELGVTKAQEVLDDFNRRMDEYHGNS